MEIESSRLVEIFCSTGLRYDMASQLVAYLDQRMVDYVRLRDLETAVRNIVAEFGPGDVGGPTQRSKMGFSDTIMLSERGNIGNEETLKWPEWIVHEGRVREMKETLFQLSEHFENAKVDLHKAFGIFDRKGLGFIPEE